MNQCHESAETTAVNMQSAPLVRASNEASIFLNQVARPKAAIFTFPGAVMAEPASSAVGGLAAWKLAGGILGIGVIASALGFLVLPPKSIREFAVRAVATMAGSAMVGPVLVIAAYVKYPEMFAAGAKLAAAWGYDPWAGHFMVAAPLLAMAGLPFWWLLGAGVLWLDRRRGKDLGELARDAAADAKAAMP